jgi:6-phosphogluconolactonase
MQVRTFKDESSWIEAALDELRAAAEAARAEARSSIALCLAGGKTPEPVYRAMAGLPLEGLAVELWLGDERAVPAMDNARNGRMAERAFAGCVWSPAPRLRLWPEAVTAVQASAAAARYEAELCASLGEDPRFDLAILGLGADGHTASVFPGTINASPGPALSPKGMAAVTISPLPPDLRMTFSLGLLARSRRRVFLARGADKLPALRALEAEDAGIPASALAGPGSLALYLG